MFLFIILTHHKISASLKKQNSVMYHFILPQGTTVVAEVQGRVSIFNLTSVIFSPFFKKNSISD